MKNREIGTWRDPRAWVHVAVLLIAVAVIVGGMCLAGGTTGG